MTSARYRKARAAYENEVKAVQEASGCNSLPEPCDISGAFVLDMSCWQLLRNPTPAVAAGIYEALLEHGRQAGWDCDGKPFDFAGDDQL